MNRFALIPERSRPKAVVFPRVFLKLLPLALDSSRLMGKGLETVVVASMTDACFWSLNARIVEKNPKDAFTLAMGAMGDWLPALIERKGQALFWSYRPACCMQVSTCYSRRISSSTWALLWQPFLAGWSFAAGPVARVGSFRSCWAGSPWGGTFSGQALISSDLMEISNSGRRYAPMEHSQPESLPGFRQRMALLLRRMVDGQPLSFACRPRVAWLLRVVGSRTFP